MGEATQRGTQGVLTRVLYDKWLGESGRAGDVPLFAGVRDESLWPVRSLDLSGNMLLADAGVTGLAFALVRATWKAMLRHAFDAMQHSINALQHLHDVLYWRGAL